MLLIRLAELQENGSSSESSAFNTSNHSFTTNPSPKLLAFEGTSTENISQGEYRFSYRTSIRFYDYQYFIHRLFLNHFSINLKIKLEEREVLVRHQVLVRLRACMMI